MTIISVYAPTMYAGEDEKLVFYLSLKELLLKVPAADKIIVVDDFNARVDKDFETLNVHGKRKVGKRKDFLLLQIYVEINLFSVIL